MWPRRQARSTTGFVDLHTHVLPALDDGPRTRDEALHLCRLAEEDGCTTVVATPHYNHPLFATPTASGVREAVLHLRQQAGSEIRILPGAEVHWNRDLFERLMSSQSIDLPTLGNSRTVLVEFPREAVGVDAALTVHELLVNDLRPLIAHPEMIPWLIADTDLLRRLVQRGALIQATAGCLLGDAGPGPRRATRDLISDGLVHALASDMHVPGVRGPRLRAAHREVSRTWDSDLADALTIDNPRAILADLPVSRAA